MSRPSNITEFRKIGKRRINCKVSPERQAKRTARGKPMPTTPEQAKALHDARQARKMAKKKREWSDIVEEDNAFQRGQYIKKSPIQLGQLRVASREHRRAKNWRKYEAIVGNTYERKVGTGTHGGWACYAYDHFVQSWGAVSPTGSKMFCQIDTDSGIHKQTIKAPRGWKWAIDANVIKLVANADRRCDYHPTANDLMDFDLAELCEKARENFASRKRIDANVKITLRKDKKSKEAAARAIKRAEREGATVCLTDSVRAGNCEAGSRTWAQRHGFDDRRHYQPSEVLAKANGDAHRVALVVNVALRRHKVEMERGYAELKEHYINE